MRFKWPLHYMLVHLRQIDCLVKFEIKMIYCVYQKLYAVISIIQFKFKSQKDYEWSWVLHTQKVVTFEVMTEYTNYHAFYIR